MTTLSEFLTHNNQSYQQALSIYHKVKRSKDKDEFFNSVSDAPKGSLHHNMLFQELKNIHRVTASQQPVPQKIPVPAKPITAKTLMADPGKLVHNPLVEVSSLPKDLQVLYFRNQDITRIMAGLHQSLRAASADSQRKEYAETIDLLNTEKQTNWEQLDEFSKNPQTKTQPHKALAIKEKIADAQQRIKSDSLSKKQISGLRLAIARWEKQLEKMV